MLFFLNSHLLPLLASTNVYGILFLFGCVLVEEGGEVDVGDN